MAFLIALMLLVGGELFIADAQAEASYTVEISRDALRGYVDDIGLFQRNMPGVLGVRSLGGGRYLYMTEKSIPLSPPMQTDFLIEKITLGDSVTVYRSVDPGSPDYMYCRVLIRPEGPATTYIMISLRVRLSRENASEVHWMAPFLGEDFISNQMTKDINEMLETFIVRSNEELYSRVATETVSAE